MRLRDVSQVQVNVRAGLTFPIVLRAFMRQDPNVVMVGEMRDAETAAVAVSAALAGQLVFTTLHANDAPRTIDRLAELGVARHSLAAALTAVVAQRLVRTLCEQCRIRESIPRQRRASLGIAEDAWYVATGCRACSAMIRRRRRAWRAWRRKSSAATRRRRLSAWRAWRPRRTSTSGASGGNGNACSIRPSRRTPLPIRRLSPN